MSLIWKRRAKRKSSDISNHRIWETICGRYRVVESVSTLGLSTLIYATVLAGRAGLPCWTLISKHRKRGPAEEACEIHAKTRKVAT